MSNNLWINMGASIGIFQGLLLFLYLIFLGLILPAFIIFLAIGGGMYFLFKGG